MSVDTNIFIFKGVVVEVDAQMETQKMINKNEEKAKSKVIGDMNKEQCDFMKDGAEKPKGDDKKIWADKPK